MLTTLKRTEAGSNQRRDMQLNRLAISQYFVLHLDRSVRISRERLSGKLPIARALGDPASVGDSA
jgi:hypothetical protein